MSFARGFIKGFIGQSLDNKAEADRRLGELTDRISLDYLNKKKPAFEKNEDLMLKRYNTIKTELGEPAALYASATGSTETDFATNRLLDLKGNDKTAFVDAVSKIDFQNFNRDLGVATRTKNFNERNKEITDTFKKIPGGLPTAVTDLFMPLPEGTMAESTFDATKLPSLASMMPTTNPNLFSSYNFKDQAEAESKARLLFFGTERRPTSGSFRAAYNADYDSEKHGPSKEMYGFRNFFENEYLKNKGITYDLPSVYGKKLVTPQATNQNLTQEEKVSLAQEAIDIARSTGQEEAVENIKEQLRKDIGITNLSELLK